MKNVNAQNSNHESELKNISMQKLANKRSIKSK